MAASNGEKCKLFRLRTSLINFHDERGCGLVNMTVHVGGRNFKTNRKDTFFNSAHIASDCQLGCVTISVPPNMND